MSVCVSRKMSTFPSRDERQGRQARRPLGRLWPSDDYDEDDLEEEEKDDVDHDDDENEDEVG